MKKEFTTALYEKIGKKMDAHERKQAAKNQIVLTSNQEGVLNDLRAGKTREDIAKKYECTKQNISRIITSLRNKGIKIQADLVKNEHISSYKVDMP